MKSDKIKLVETPFGVQVVSDFSGIEEFDDAVDDALENGTGFHDALDAMDFNDECGDR